VTRKLSLVGKLSRIHQAGRLTSENIVVMYSLLQNMFVVSTDKVSFVSALQTDTIYTI
jgi:hypothetical protein